MPKVLSTLVYLGTWAHLPRWVNWLYKQSRKHCQSFHYPFTMAKHSTTKHLLLIAREVPYRRPIALAVATYSYDIAADWTSLRQSMHQPAGARRPNLTYPGKAG